MDNVIFVNTNEVCVTSKDKKVIGCDTLTYCFSLLLYNEEEKIATVGHFAITGWSSESQCSRYITNLFKDEYEKMIMELKKVTTVDNSTKIKYYVITPLDYSDKTIDNLDYLDGLCYSARLEPLDVGSDYEISTTVKYGNDSAKAFLFDADKGLFVTKDYYNVNNKKR